MVHYVRQTTTSLLIGFAGAELASCSSSPFDGSYTDLVKRDLGQLEPSEQRVLTRADHNRSRPLEATDDPLEARTADDFVQLALERNPSLQAARQRVLRLKERVPQVTSFDDPMLNVVPVGEMAETAAGQVKVMTGLSQKLPFPGKLDAKGRIATQNAAIAEQDQERVRLSVIGDTRRAYWGLYYSVRAIEITKQNRELLSQLREVVQAKYRAGTATQEAVLRASVELNNLENELITLEQRRSTTAGMLNMLIDRAVSAPLADPGRVELASFDGRLEDLLGRAERTNPSIRAVREQIEMYHEQRKLARLGRYPDLTVSLSYNLVDDSGLSGVSNGDDQWWLGLGVNLPLWQGRLVAAEREATRGILESASLLAGEQNRVAFRVQDAFIKVDTQQRQSVLLHDVIVPEASQTVEASLSGYRSGEVDFLTLIDNWRKLLDFQLMYQASLTEFERSFAELQQTVGHDLERHTVVEPSDATPEAETENGL